MTFTIRDASAADVAAMHRVRTSVKENRLSDPRNITEASYFPYVAARTAWVAETEADVAGFAAIDASSQRVWALFVDPEAEGAGIGRALHQRMLSWARAQGIHRLSLSTSRDTRAARFYALAGWTEAGVTADGEVCFERTLPD